MCVWLNNIFQSKCKSVIILKRNLMKPSNGIPWRGQVAYFWWAHRPHQDWVTYLFLAKSSHLLCNHLLCLELHLACLTPSSENLSWKAFFPFYRCRSWDSRKLNGFTCSAGKWHQGFSFCALLLLSTLSAFQGVLPCFLAEKHAKGSCGTKSPSVQRCWVMSFSGLAWWSRIRTPHFQCRGTQVRSLAVELDPTCRSVQPNKYVFKKVMSSPPPVFFSQ